MNVKIELTEVDRRLIERINERINVQTYIDEDNWIEINDLLALLDDLDDAYSDVTFEFDEYKDTIKDNYKPIDVNDNYSYYASTIQKLDAECNRQWNFIKEKGLEEEYDEYQR